MKRTLILVVYWMASILLTAFLVVSLGYTFWQSMLIGLMFLPCAMMLSFFLPKVSREAPRVRTQHRVYIILGVLVLAFFLLLLIHMFFAYVKYLRGEAPSPYMLDFVPMLGNPIFLAVVLTLLAYGEFLLKKKLFPEDAPSRPITFTSEYKKVKILAEDILYIESRDSEVWIYTRGGQQYRNKTGITQWENALGPGFLRIHRAFLVNVKEASHASPESVSVAGVELPISRKYKETVQHALDN